MFFVKTKKMKKKLEEEKKGKKHKSSRTMRSDIFQSCPEKKNLLILDLLKGKKA